MAHPIPARSTKIAPEKKARDVPLLQGGCHSSARGTRAFGLPQREAADGDDLER